MSRSVFITGESRGIGLAIARAFLQAGDNVAITYRTSTPGSYYDDLRFSCVHAVECDVTDQTAVKRAFTAGGEQQGPVQILVANAGIIHDAAATQLDVSDFDEALNTNLVGAFRVAKRALATMLPARWGRIIFISDSTAFGGQPGRANYAASKTGLLGLAGSLAHEVGPYNITVNLVAPGLTDTDIKARWPATRWPATRWSAMCARTALGRSARSQEVAAPVTFLVSNDASYITGAVIRVDGGLGMGR